MLKYQKRQLLNSSFCCVPSCSVSGKFNSSVSFHQFPKDESVRAIWVRNIRRDKFVIRRHTTVCSRHFMQEDVVEGGRRRLKPGAIPVLFAWNNYNLPVTRPSVWQRTQREEEDEDEGEVPIDASVALCHDYDSRPEPAFMDLAYEKIHAQQQNRCLPLIDELFLFLVYLSLGLKERDLADRFNVHQSTVSRTIRTWANFLYTVLGAVGIWMSPDAVRAMMPDVFEKYSDTQVIVDCTELKCQAPSSLLLQSEMYSQYKSHTTVKGMIGVSPHGAVTFVSTLYSGSISDKELFKQSGIIPLLDENMAVMVDKGFSIDDLVPGKVHRPPFLGRNSQLSREDVLATQEIARLRIHVERVIRRIKQNKLFDSIIPLTINGSINQLFAVACLLSNYQNKPLVKAWAK
uniref:THAP-type domain-containing protein n=1 Tax=Gadus morhua TaxID=8049 RepID=A0A8C5CWV9_GADMO